jgi:murein DD-endopeptidase MepM/ murein hydrolase activator NlpD
LTSNYGSRRDPFTGGRTFTRGSTSDQSRPARAGHGQWPRRDSQPHGNYGNLVVIEHGFGLVTKYGHLSRFGVTIGQQVSRGDVVGYVGSTGRSTSPHLHYEIWMNDQLMNPMRLLGSR